MREIKFRGRRIDNGEWVYGYLIGNDVIVGNIVEFNDEYFNTEYWWKVVPETVGQYTGLKDKNGKEIYEGDIVREIKVGFEEKQNIDDFDVWLESEKAISYEVDDDGFIEYSYPSIVDVVVMDRFPRYWLKGESFGFEGEDLIDPSDCEVIGNIYEHPYLLKGDENE